MRKRLALGLILLTALLLVVAMTSLATPTQVQALPTVRENQQMAAAVSAPSAPLKPDDGVLPASMELLPPPVYVARAPDEWQGALVNENLQIPCQTSATCGLALACIDGICSACTADSECLLGERCAMQHCVLSQNFSCGSRRDCAANELCELSPLSPGPRGNANTRSHCSNGLGGDELIEPAAPTDITRTDRADNPTTRTANRVREMLGEQKP
jgi:hypothetical protein